MDTDALAQQVQDTLIGIFQRGSRYQTEKVAVLVGYLVISVASLVWAFSGKNLDNQLGADFGQTTLSEIDQGVYFLSNDSDDDWTQVRVVLNRQYLYTNPEIQNKSRVTLSGKDFDYFYFIPRTWGKAGWEKLDKSEKPGPKAPNNLKPTFVQIRTEQGKFDKNLSAEPKKDN